ncbi:hypothetical protein B0A48_06715 [Cryoendolithus antarcticus]|uniref:Uncharacterized protein n=1 Tax=Cryoendolithus antarcticus TaxID=1507870 RepID=A0A1V8T944_9PEZI|nr:hypothetical protein B0A48_06715 [Cryoendolithus antarcticus]
MASTWETLNAPSSVLPKDPSAPFTLTTAPKTDIWRHPTLKSFNAPAVGRRVPFKHFTSIKTTVSGPWRTQFDQGGLFLVFLPSPSSEPSKSQWVKAGIEFFNGEAKLGVVGTDKYSDWSLCPMFEKGQSATFEAVKDGETLWVYAVVGGKREALREVKWAEMEREGEIWVGVYAAKPTAEEGDAEKGLEVRFEGVEVVTGDEK